MMSPNVRAKLKQHLKNEGLSLSNFFFLLFFVFSFLTFLIISAEPKSMRAFKEGRYEMAISDFNEKKLKGLQKEGIKVPKDMIKRKKKQKKRREKERDW